MNPHSRLTIPDVADLFAAYKRRPGNSEWGALHVVLADGNTKDVFCLGCAEEARAKGDREGEGLACLLLHLTRTQRRKLPLVVDRRL